MREPIHSRRSKAALVRTSMSLFILLLSVSAICCGPKAPEKASLTVEVGVDYSLGGIQPVARQEFFLINRNLIELLGGKADDPKSIIKLWDLTAFVGSYAETRREEISKILKDHSAARATTNLQGKATFLPVTPGIYYIVGWSTVREKGKLIIWNYRVELKAGAQEVSLSSTDAATVASYF
jgi:hypothetical protein